MPYHNIRVYVVLPSGSEEDNCDKLDNSFLEKYAQGRIDINVSFVKKKTVNRYLFTNEHRNIKLLNKF